MVNELYFEINEVVNEHDAMEFLMFKFQANAENIYEKLVELGYSNEQAREYLKIKLETTISYI